MKMSQAKTIVRVGGIPVRIDASWIFISVLLTWSFWARFTIEHGRPGRYQVGVAFVMAVIATLLFGASVLAHELAHAFVARRRGLQVEGITLYLFGGATETATEARRWGDEFALTAAGPLTNILLGGLFWLVAYLGQQSGLDAVTYVAGELAWLNLLLGVFNLIPGSPLDGGRLLEAVAWRVTRDQVRATTIAANAGQAIGLLILSIGLYELFFVLGGASSGIWLGLTGWFILQGATAERAHAELRRILAGVPAGRLAAMPRAVPAGVPVMHVLGEWTSGFPDAVFVTNGDAIAGVLTVNALRRVPRLRWSSTTAGQVAVPLASLPTIASDDPVTNALTQLARGPVIVKDGDQLVGLLTVERVAAAAERMRQLGRMDSWRTPG
jgi:Zn-dependent protease